MDLWLLIFEVSIWLFGMMRKKAISVADNRWPQISHKKAVRELLFSFFPDFSIAGK